MGQSSCHEASSTDDHCGGNATVCSTSASDGVLVRLGIMVLCGIVKEAATPMRTSARKREAHTWALRAFSMPTSAAVPSPPSLSCGAATRRTFQTGV